MSIERIREAFTKDSEGRFYILYGKGIDDAFIAFNSREITIENALNTYLKRNGFERIAHIAPHKPVRYLDEASRQAAKFSWGEDLAKDDEQANEMQILGGGPLGNAFLVSAPVREPHPWLGDNPQGDVHALRELDVMMREEDGPVTAVVIAQAESYLNYFDDPRTLAGIVGDWFHLPGYNQNICICLFSCDRFEALREAADRIPVPEIKNLIYRTDNPEENGNLIEIPGPEKTEIVRLLRYGSAFFDIPIVEAEMDTLASWMAAEGQRARQWLARISEAPSLDLETARKMGWFSASRDDRRAIMERLNVLVGLNSIKERIFELSAWLSVQKQKNADQPGLDNAPMLHMVFTGNPGTGKTTVARMIGQMFHDLGLLKKGHLVEVKSSDLVADHVGGTAIKTNEVINKALHGVLFIDEAYSLTEAERGGYGSEAVDILLKRMEDDRSRLVVVVAGYPEKMSRFLQSNPGLTRRFPKENHFYFPDYSPDELWEILAGILTARGIFFSDDMILPLREIIDAMYASRDEWFGNAGEMRNFAEGLDRRRAYRIVKNSLHNDALLTPVDIPEKYQSFLAPRSINVESVIQELDDLVGIAPVKDFARSLANRLVLDQARQRNGASGEVQAAFQHLVFTGSPGTGKTTVARLLGRVYQSLGLLRRGHCVEVTRADLVAGYVGQTALKTREKIKEALDGILFIDEAYSLDRGGPTDYGREVIDTLIKAMEDYRSRLIVIAAGYPVEMEHFILANPGIKSRFAGVVQFPDFEPEELLQIFEKRVEREGFTCAEGVMQQVKANLEVMKKTDGFQFGNGRAVNNLFDQMKGRLAERVAHILQGEGSQAEGDTAVLSQFLVEDVPSPTAAYPVVTCEPGISSEALPYLFPVTAQNQHQVVESRADYQTNGPGEPPRSPNNYAVKHKGRDGKSGLPY